VFHDFSPWEIANNFMKSKLKEYFGTDHRSSNKCRYVFPVQYTLLFAGYGNVMLARSLAVLEFKPCLR